MNFNEYKDTLHEGNRKSALKQLAKEGYSLKLTTTKSSDALQSILDSMDEQTANDYMKYFYAEHEKNPERFNKFLKISTLLTLTKLEWDEVENAKVNPFIKKFWVKLGIFLGIIAASVIFILLAHHFGYGEKEFVSYVPAIAVAIYSFSFTESIINVFRFKKLKRLIAEQVANTEE